MKTKITLLVITGLLFVAFKQESKLTLSFLDEHVIKDSINFKGTLIGGLSGIDYNNGSYYMVIDDDKSPRIVKATINIEKDTISKVKFLDVIHLNDSIPFYQNNVLDLESVFIDEKNNIHLVSEGAIKKDKNPAVFSINQKGEFIESFKLPEYFKVSSGSKPRHNAVFEASCKSFDKKGFWVGMEGVLKGDGEAPSQLKENQPARITYFDFETKKATKQFAYPLDYIKRPSKGGFNVNGITAILEYTKNTFFVIERAFQNGYGNIGNTVKIYKVELDNTVTNTFETKSLLNTAYTPAKKELIFDFDLVRDELTDGIVDNIEGFTLGPKLSNGNQSLIVITDDNFQKHGRQLNQFILLEVNE